ncbi:MAG TPA: hypothetical protein VE999_07615 [Gemmataceae bacterium]|nr:hypothetical protein [Gemmataceae bacterium]
MHEHDAILLAAFDDEPQPVPPTALAETRPIDRPRPDPSTFPGTDPISLVIFDSVPESKT